MTLAKHIRSTRRAFKLTQEEAAKRAAMRQGHWSEIESGRSVNVTWKVVVRMAKALQASLDKWAE